MLSWLTFYLVLTAACWACVWPMLREPRLALTWVAPETFDDVPVVTFDSRGFA